ncbi:O-antigen ligase family protein [Bradyrhizobium arachidis]|uniref:O-antigen ligase family protein n=1 Tax=Bradyrhizobium arachidis TaxID=858423 RepID=A0AAE7NP57_9BRAD|nr:O-antigen ligase family protein [Bradyrhizobium arachidis]QOZ66933.1 O-antigen ligase family protein [Bradyrhizobium arachidis]SFV13800.1 O-antigen ligase [Bradyrhizobium arachidis]
MTLARAALFWLLATRTSAEIVIGLFGRTSGGDEGGFSLGAIFNLAALLIATVALLYWSRSRSKLPILVWAPYLIIAAGSLTYTTEVGDSARLLMSTLTFPAIFLSAFILLRTIEDVANLLLCIIYSSIVPTVVAFYQIATGGLGGMTGDRLQSTFSHPNVFAFYVIAVICAILYYNLVAHRHVTAIWRAFLFSYIPVLLAFLLITQTRSAWLGMAAFIVIYAIGVDRKLLVALPCAPLVLMLPVVSQRFEGIGAEPTITFEDVQSGYVVANSYGWRQLLWGRALEDSADARVLGKGLGTLGKNALHFFPLSEHATEAHSAYVQTIYELGILGLLAYLMLYLGIIGAVFIYRRRAPRLAYIVIGFGVVNLLISYSDNLPYYLSYNWYVWAIFGADFALRFGVLQPAPRRLQTFAEMPSSSATAAQPR